MSMLRGTKHSEETKQKIGIANKGKKRSLIQCQKLSEAFQSSDACKKKLKKMHENNKGKKLTLEHKHRISIGVKNSPLHKIYSESLAMKSGDKSPFWKRIRCQCQICGLDFYKIPSRVKAHNGKFCSKKCYSVWLSENLKGEKSLLWRGGLTAKNKLLRNSAFFRTWRAKVFERDNFTCRKCNIRSGNGKSVYLEAHHIKSFAKYPDLRFIVDNGMTLCKPCHATA